MSLFNKNFNDIGLGVLSMIKKIKGDAVAVDQLSGKDSKIIAHNSWTSLLQKHIDDSGAVDYQGFKKDKIQFQAYLDLLSSHPPGGNWTKEEKLSYWINAYNAFTVKLIIDNYPLKSIKDISNGLTMINSPWDIKFFTIDGIDFDLNTIEHQILRKKFDEPRIHFAINCASYSCPVLRNEAYEADSLEAQLEDQTKKFIHDTTKNFIGPEKTELSKIFSWFESDFSKYKSVSQFIQRYHDQISSDNSIHYLPYDWSLNDKR